MTTAVIPKPITTHDYFENARQHPLWLGYTEWMQKIGQWLPFWHWFEQRWWWNSWEAYCEGYRRAMDEVKQPPSQLEPAPVNAPPAAPAGQSATDAPATP